MAKTERSEGAGARCQGGRACRAVVAAVLLAGMTVPAGMAAAFQSASSRVAPSPPASPPDTTRAPVARGQADPESARLVQRMGFVLGGREAWEAAAFIGWRNEAARRSIRWDRPGRRVRVELAWGESEETYVVQFSKAKAPSFVLRDGEPIEEGPLREGVLAAAREAFVIDRFALFLPYLLREPGVRLRGFGLATMRDGRAADLIEVTFPGEAAEGSLPLAPSPKYWVGIARDTGLVGQWDIFDEVDARMPARTEAWREWRRRGGMMIAAQRGEHVYSDLVVRDHVPAEAFDEMPGSSPNAADAR